MPHIRIFAGAAALALFGGTAMAQTGATGGYGAQSTSPSGMGAMQSPTSPAQPYAPPPMTGGMAQPQTGGQSSMGGMTGGSAMQPPGVMSPGMTAPATAGFTPVRPVPGANIIATLQASGEFTKLLAALQATNLTGLISSHPNLTLFAPTDAAFAQLPPGQLDQLMKSPQQLQALLTYHLVATTIRDADVRGHAAGKVPAANNKSLSIDGSGPSLKVNDATVLQSGVAASNGVIYPIDKVLTPPAA